MRSRDAGSIYLLLSIGYSIFSNVLPGTRMSQLFLFLFLGFSCYYAIKCLLMKGHPAYIKLLFVLLITFTIYGCAYLFGSKSYVITEGGLYETVPKIQYLKNIYKSLLPIVAFYYFSCRGYITEKWIRNVSLLLLILAIFLFYWRLHIFVVADEFGRTELTNNFGYSFVALIPFLYFWREKPYIQILCCFILLLFIIWSMKRGAILTGGICLIYFICDSYKRAHGNKKVAVVLLSIAGIIIAGNYILDYISSSDYAQKRIQQTLDGDSSSRDQLYSTSIQYILSRTNFWEFLFGTGPDSSIEILGNYAHNDWFEIAINQGLFGLILYLFYFVAFMRTCLYGKTFAYYEKSILGTCFIICFMSTLFSMSYCSVDISLAVCVGYVMSYNRTELA